MDLYQEEEILSLEDATWKTRAITAFKEKMTNRAAPFPCIPATQGYVLQHFRYGFLSDPRHPASSKELASLLKSFTQVSKTLGKYASLIVFYDTPSSLTNCTVEEMEQLFWQQLTDVSALDEKSWPSHIPEDAMNSAWEFCFHGEPYFMYCATPLHVARKSRSFPFFTLAITPRWVLEQFEASPPIAQKIKAEIRQRLFAYDEIPPHPELKKYGEEDNYEWKQYFLRDDESELVKCPFLRAQLNKQRGG